MPTPITDSDLPSGKLAVRPYAYSVLLFLVGCTIMWVGNRLLLEYVFPWSLVALLVVGATAIYWGNKPAVLVLTLSVVFSDILLPDLRSTHFQINVLSSQIQMLRMPLFALCGGTVIWLTHQSRLIQERAEKRKSVVDTLQLMTLPRSLPVVPGYDISSSYRPARTDEGVGGDFYDFFLVRKSIYGILIGDVVGKGKEAAISTAMLRYSVRSFASLKMSPAQIMCCTNDMIERQKMNFQTATLFFGLLDSTSGEFRYSSAGHEPPQLKLANGGCEPLHFGGPMLGIGDQLTYDESSVYLCKDDILLMVTDGVTEARSVRGDFLGSEGITRLLNNIPKEWNSHQTVAQLDFAISQYTSGSYRDDLAMLLLKRTD